MKNGKIIGKVAAMSLAIALFAGKSQAAFYSLTAGTFSVSTHNGGTCQNPNGYPVVTLWASPLANGVAGFLLDGSESASNWLKILQEASVSNRRVTVYTDDKFGHAVCGQVSEFGTTASAYKILAVAVGP